MKNPNSKDGKVRLWTRQDNRCLDILEKKGRFTNRDYYLREKFGDIANFFMNKYGWFVDIAKQSVPKPDDVNFPIWCSVAEEYMLRPTLNEVVLEIEKDESEVVYFDGVRWDLVLNHMYIPKDEADNLEYEAHLKKLGIKNRHTLVEGRDAVLFPEEHKRVLESWHRVFEVPAWDYFRIQANIWEIKKDEVKRVWTIEDVKAGRVIGIPG